MILLIHEKEAETQAEGEGEKQAPCRERDAELNPGTPESCPGLKAGAKLLSHPGIPCFVLFFNKFFRIIYIQQNASILNIQFDGV